MPNTRVVTAVCGAALAFVLCAVGTACSTGSDHRKQSEPSGEPSVPYVVRLTTVTGRLPHHGRATVRKQVGIVIHNWWDAAYLKSGFKETFVGFTPGAAKRAQRDRDLLSDPSRLQGALTDVVRQRADLDVLAVKGSAKGVTARLHLTYDKDTDLDSGPPAERCTVGGTVSLIAVHGSWRIFGYDVTHTCAAPKATPSGKAS